MKPMMGGEDFSVFRTIAPSVFAGIDAGPESGDFYINHHPKFCVDESALPTGTAMYIAFAVRAAREGFAV
jgi:metal-dependent amidase/aminoacylase/carboxypeptidase family protein